MTIYVIMGSTGEYSDRGEWSIGYVTDEEKAKAIVLEMDNEAKKRRPLDNFGYRERLLNYPKGWNKYQPELGAPDYTGFYFWYDEVKNLDNIFGPLA